MSAAPVTTDASEPGRRFTATAALPYDNLERATAGLRGRLRLMITDYSTDADPDPDTLTISGPVKTKDARGNTWFQWTAVVQARSTHSGD